MSGCRVPVSCRFTSSTPFSPALARSLWSDRRRGVFATVLVAGLVVGFAGCSSSPPGTAADAGATGASTPLRNVDVTIVYPLPAASQLDALLKPSDQGLGGDLLSASVFDQGQVPELDARDPLASDAARLAALRVVAVRVDACPAQAVPPPPAANCAPELRLVFQSLKVNGAETAARDGALHAFYPLSPSAFAAVLRELRDIRATSLDDPPLPLDVHPRLREQGPTGPYANRIKALVLASAGVSNLARVTHFRRLTGRPAWVFSLREPVNGVWQDRTIPTTATTQQTVFTVSGGGWGANIIPAITGPDDPAHLMEVPLAEQALAFGAVVRVLNPRKHNAQSTDCASCHVAPDIAIFAETTMSLKVADDPDRFQSSYPLDAVAKSVDEVIAFENLHMTSYSNRVLSLSARTVNETAAVLEAINATISP